MNLPLSSFRWILLFTGLVVLIIGAELFAVQSSAFSRYPDWVSTGVTIDMVVIIPAFYYVLIVRHLKINAKSLLAVFGIVLSITTRILPANHQQFIDLLRQSLILLELFFVGYALLRIKQLISHYQQLSVQNPDFTRNLLHSLDTILGHSRFNRILVSELSILRYGLLGSWVPVEKTAADKAFSSHQASGQTALTIGLMLVGLIETVVLHVLLNRWSPLVAWCATIAGFYGLLFFVADLVATIKRPVLIRDNQVIFRFGLRSYGEVAIHLIDQIVAINDKPERHSDLLTGTLLAAPNLLITLREPVVMNGPFGTQRSVRRIALRIDNKQQFIQELTH